jgi:hypothetical protein
MNYAAIIALAIATTALPAVSAEYQIKPRAMQIVVGDACRMIEDGESKKVVYESIRDDLEVRGLSKLEARQAAKVISQNAQSICGKS